MNLSSVHVLSREFRHSFECAVVVLYREFCVVRVPFRLPFTNNAFIALRKKSLLGFLTIWWGHVQLYMRTTCSSNNVLQRSSHGEMTEPGRCQWFQDLTWGAVFFPLPAKYETVSHPLTASKNGRASDCSWASEVVTLWTCRYLKWFPTPKAIHKLFYF